MLYFLCRNDSLKYKNVWGFDRRVATENVLFLQPLPRSGDNLL